MKLAEETRIIKIEIDQTTALKDLEATENALINLKDEQKALNEQLKQGTITQQEYVASKVQLDQKIKQETDNRKTLTQAINTESNSLAAQKLKLKELIGERDKIDRSTVEGAKKFDQMNGSILKLNGSIKEAEQQGGSFQRNVGNYKGTIDQFTGGAYSAAQGIAGMTKAALAFIATPIGAIIAAVGLALGALMAYFKGSEEGQNRWNKIVTVSSTILEKMVDVVEDLGEFVFDTGRALIEAFSNPKKLMEDVVNFLKDQVINRFKAFAVIAEGIANMDFKQVANGVLQFETGVVDVIGKVEKLKDAAVEYGKKTVEAISGAVKAGSDLADMEAQFDRESRERTIAKSKRDLDVSLLRRKADEAEGEEKLKYLNQALDLEAQNVKAMVATATLARDIAKTKADLNGKDKQLKDDLAKAEAELLNAQRGAFDETRKMNKERIATEKQIRDELIKQIDANQKLEFSEQQRIALANQKADEELEKGFERLEKKNEAREDSMLINMENVEAEAEAEMAAAEMSYDWYVYLEERKRAEAKKTQETILAVINGTLDVTSDIFSKITSIKLQEGEKQLQDLERQTSAELSALTDSVNEQIDLLNEQSKAERDIKRAALDAETQETAFQKEELKRIKEAYEDADLAFRIAIDAATTEEERKALQEQQSDLKLAYDQQKLELERKLSDQVAAEQKAKNDLKAQEERAKEELKKIEEKAKADKLAIEQQAARDQDEIKRKAFEVNKKNKIADSIIDAVQSAIAAFRSLVGIPIVGPVLAAAASAAALVFGYKQVDLIRNEQYTPGSFSIGGYTGPGGVNDPAGTVHRGEVVWNQRDVAAVGGPHVANAMRPTYQGYADGGIVASAATNMIDQQFINGGMMPPIQLSLTEFDTAQMQRAIKVQIVEA